MARFNGIPVVAAEPAATQSHKPRFNGVPVVRNVPAPNPEGDGLWANAGAAIDNGINAILGIPVDLPVSVGNSLINATNSAVEMAGAGRPVPNIPVDLPGSRLGWEKTQENLGFTPASQVKAVTPEERIIRSGVEAATQALVPELLLARGAQAVQTGARTVAPLVKQGVEALAPMFGAGQSAGKMGANLAVNAAAGAGAQAGVEIAPEGWEAPAALAGGLLAGAPVATLTAAPTATRVVADVAGDYLAPVTAAGQERLAGQTLRGAATDAAATIDLLDNLPANRVPGSNPTTFQATGDMGLGGLERAVDTRNPVEFNQRRAEQNAARLRVLSEIQPTGAPEKVATSVRIFIQSIDDDAEAAVEAMRQQGNARVAAAEAGGNAAITSATQQARNAAGNLGAGRPPELIGDEMRGALETARSEAKVRERALWQTVDPDGTLALPASTTKKRVASIQESMTPVSAKPQGEEAAIYADIGKLPAGAVPFGYFTELDSRLKTAMRVERLASGESPAYRRLSQLKSSIETDLDRAITSKVSEEQQAVSAGNMSLEQTAAFRIEQWQQNWKQRQTEARALDAGSFAANGTGGSTAVSRARGAASEARVGSGDTQGNSGLPGDAGRTEFDQAAIDRLAAARSATRERVSTFDNSMMGPIRKGPGAGNYVMSASEIPTKVFMPGSKATDAIRAYREAVGDDRAINLLTDHIVDRLRKTAMDPDGTLNPVKVNSFRRTYADALRAFPELDARFGGAADASSSARDAASLSAANLKQTARAAEDAIAESAARRKQSVSEAQKGALGRIMGLDDPSDVTRTVGAIFSRQDAVNEFGRLRKAIEGDPEAKTGLRKAVVDYVTDRFVSNAEAATSDQNMLKADGFQTFVKANQTALRMAGLTEAEAKTMQAIAADLRQANRSIVAVKLPGRSNTAQDGFAAKVTDTQTTMLAKIAAQGATTGGVTTIVLGPLLGIPVGVATTLVSAMRQAGLSKVDDIIRDAMLNPERARLLMQKATPKTQQQLGLVLAQQYRRAAMTSGIAASDTKEQR